MRILGCSGVNITGVNGATSAIWLALHEDPKSIDPNVLYHSDITRLGVPWVKEITSEITEEDLKIGKSIMRKLDLSLV